MKAPSEILTQWKLEKEHGDIAKIAKKYKKNRSTIKDAIYTGNMDQETFDSISEFYSNRRKAKKRMITQALK